MGVHINPVYLSIALFGWLLVYHFVYRLALILREPTLVCWGVGPAGVVAVSLRKPRVSLSLAQFFYAAVAMGSAIYLSLFVVRPAPVSGLEPNGPTLLAAIAAPVVVVTLVALVAQLRARRYPLWGEARVLSAVQRALALGTVLFFTPLGRTFLHDRFNATPNEFIQTIRS